jgi:hypothetical protein
MSSILLRYSQQPAMRNQVNTKLASVPCNLALQGQQHQATPAAQLNVPSVQPPGMALP